MNFKKILAIGLILIALSISVNAVCAGTTTVDLGKITSASVDVNGITERPTVSGPTFGTPSPSTPTKEYSVDFTANIQIDISKMSDADKDSFRKALDEGNNTLILNITDGNMRVSIELPNQGDVSIDGDTVNIGVSTSYTTHTNSGNPTLTSVGIRTGDNHLFVAKK